MRKLLSPGKSAHAEGYRKSDTEYVDDHADDHQLHGKRALGGSGERQHNAVHEEIDGHAIENARNNRMLYQRTNSAARHKVDRSCTKCDDEVTKKAKERRCEPALECLRSQQSAGNSLQQGHRLEAEVAVDHERGRNVQDAARKAAPYHGKHSARVFLQRNLRCCIRNFCKLAYTTDFTLPINASVRSRPVD